MKEERKLRVDRVIGSNELVVSVESEKKKFSIYVDTIQNIKSDKWKYNTCCHLYTDSNDINDLHEFAQKLGLKRIWFQEHKILPHYDVTANKRQQAVKLGALEDSGEIRKSIFKKVLEKQKEIKK